MIKLGRIFSEKETANFLINKVDEPYITPYINHIAGYPRAQQAPLAIFPNLHVFNFPGGQQTVNNSGTMSAAEAIFKVKTITACKLRYQHSNATTAPVDKRACNVTKQYTRKLKKLDQQYAAELVGEGGILLGPFKAA